ncbi:hypothetical protein FB451DRAFT_1307041 [Mycena latifolia]|nr:hypothetical protein FB451DRAFT_1307041 [Mycena latifolia]
MDNAEIQRELNANYYLNLVAFTLLFYEYFLTLDWEVSRYWAVEFKWPNLLFFANRYGALLGNIPVVIQFFWTTPSSPNKLIVRSLPCRCSSLETYHQYFILATQFVVGAMLLLRTYALYERNNRILAFIAVVSAGTIGVAVWAVLSGKTGDNGVNLPLYIGCTYAISHSKSLGLAGAWAGMATFDSMIFILTLYRAFSRHNANGLNLLGVLLRDGSVLIIVAASLSNILTFLPYTRGVVTTFANIIAAIMISRLMLNIRDPALSMRPEERSRSTAWTGTGITGVFSSTRLEFAALEAGAPLSANAGTELLGPKNPTGAGTHAALV